jgi:DNA-binding MarR family transcriptional regulator
MPSQLPAPPADVAALVDGLRPALLRLSRKLRRESHQLGLSPIDMFVLAGVKLRPGVGVCELADDEQISRPTMSAHVKRLEAAGWIERQAPDASDKRRVGLALTHAGAEALEAVRRQRNDWLAARLGALSPQAREALRQAIGPLSQLAGDRP